MATEARSCALVADNPFRLPPSRDRLALGEFAEESGAPVYSSREGGSPTAQRAWTR
jgi:hypothetical protein